MRFSQAGQIELIRLLAIWMLNISQMAAALSGMAHALLGMWW
jgi:hypothetical protein